MAENLPLQDDADDQRSVAESGTGPCCLRRVIDIGSVYHPVIAIVYGLKDRKAGAKEIARERIDILVASALREKDAAMAERQAMLAKKVAMRHRVRIPYQIRQLYCKKCKGFIVPGRTSRVRIGRASVKAVRLTCARCGHTYRRVIPEGSVEFSVDFGR